MHARVIGIVAACGFAAATNGVGQSGALHRSDAGARSTASSGLASDARQGFWFGGGVGAGAGSMRCSVCANEADRGNAAYLRFGTTVTRSLLLGIEGTGWQRSAEAGTRRLVALSSAAWWYPSPQHGYYVKGGVGVSRWRAWEEDEAVVSQALAISVGAGYEVRVNPVLSVVPFVTVLGSASGALWAEAWEQDVSFRRDRLPASGHAVLVQIGIGITRH
jgi:hypothetical protein